MINLNLKNSLYYDQGLTPTQVLNEVQFKEKKEIKSFFCHGLNKEEVAFACKSLQKQGYKLTLEQNIY